MFAGSLDDLGLGKAGTENFDEISSGTTDALNDVMRIELEGKAIVWTFVIDPVVKRKSFVETVCFGVPNVGRRFGHAEFEGFV
jgi:hypothetical protein